MENTPVSIAVCNQKRRRWKINLHRSACQPSPLYLAAGRAGRRLDYPQWSIYNQRSREFGDQIYWILFLR